MLAPLVVASDARLASLFPDLEISQAEDVLVYWVRLTPFRRRPLPMRCAGPRRAFSPLPAELLGASMCVEEKREVAHRRDQ